MKLPPTFVFVNNGDPLPRGYGMAYEYELGWVCAPVPINMLAAACRHVWARLVFAWVPRGRLGRLMAESYIRGHRKGRHEGFVEGYDQGAAAEQERILRNFYAELDKAARESAARYCDSLTSTEQDPNLKPSGEALPGTVPGEAEDPCRAEVHKMFDEYDPDEKRPPA